jgi:cysteine desulfuration protein SufE
MMDERQKDILETFDIFDDWLEKYQYIIDLGKKLEPVSDNERTEENRLHGCQSQVWMVHEKRPDGTLHFRANSDAAIVSGLIALVLSIYNDRTPEEILRLTPEFIEKLGLQSHLSMTRSNGLNAMIERIRQVARENLPA